jgi:3-methylcrotonyl-CoA carboxylase alpha subunit
MEARIYSEDPKNNFLPGSGNLEVLREPNQSKEVRVDTGVREGDTITTFYDPMISKLIVSAPDREQAIQLLYNSLLEYKVKGLPTNIEFLKRVLMNKDFKDWNYDTSFIALNEEELLGEVNLPAAESELMMAQLAVSNIWMTN